MQVRTPFPAQHMSTFRNSSESSPFAFSRWLHLLVLDLILLLSIFLNFFRLDQIGDGTRYYTAGVRSMLDSWHNFFFVSFDPGGFITLDKPPLGFWIQAMSAKLFGFSGVSLLAPEAVAGVVSVALLYLLVARAFGAKAGLLAALALAVSPLSVVISRNNTIDMLLVCTTLFATLLIFRATETGRLSWLLAAAGTVGVGFNIKSLEAYLVVPAFGLLYLLGSQHRWRVRSLHALAAAGVLLGVSLIWITMVDLTPALERPYVGSTSDNSEFSLAFGYNGLSRLLGHSVLLYDSPLPDEVNRYPSIMAVIETNAIGGLSELTANILQNAQIQPATPLSPNANEESPTGNPGPFRLFGPQLSSQIAWLLPLALMGLLVAIWRTRWRFPLTRQQQSLILWGGTFLTMGVFFSFAAVFNAYYMVMFAPSICAVAAIGIVAMWQEYRRHSWSAWFLPIALVLAAVMQALYLSSYPGFASVLAPIIVTICTLVAIVLVAAHLLSNLTDPASVHFRNASIVDDHSWGAITHTRLLRLVVVLAFLSLLIAPFVWGSYTVLSAPSVQRTAGPQPQMTFQAYLSAWESGITQYQLHDRSLLIPSKLDRYLLLHRGQAKFIVATLNADLAAPIILATNQPVLTLGGFTGNDPIFTTQQLVTLINKGTVRFFLVQVPGQKTHNDTLLQWVSSHCGKIQANKWASGNIPPGITRSPNGEELFDCSHHS